MNRRNFGPAMEKVSRILIFALTLLVIEVPLLHASVQGIFLAGIPAAGDVSIFEENGKVGLKDDAGQILIPAQFEALGWTDGSFSLVNDATGYRINGSWGIIHLTRARITSAIYESLNIGAGNLIIARKRATGTLRSRTGCLDVSGRTIIPFDYDAIELTSSLRAVVQVVEGNRYKQGLIDLNNSVIIPPAYRKVYPLGSLRYAVENFEGKTAVFADDGRQVIDFVIDSLTSFRNDHAIFFQSCLQGVINRNGDVVIPASYREVSIDGGVITGRENHEWLFLDGGNTLKRKCNADSVAIAGNGLYHLYFGDRFRLTGNDFEPLAPQMFSRMDRFENGRAVAVSGGRAGVIKHNGEFAVAPVFFELQSDGYFLRGRQLLYNVPKWLLLDSAGARITPKGYDAVGPWNGRFFPVMNRGYWGAVDETGNEIIACVHDSIVQYRDEHVVVKFKGSYGIIDTNESWKVTPQLHPLELINDSLYFLKAPGTTFLKGIGRSIIYFTENPIELRGDHLLEYISTGAMWRIEFSGTISARYELPEKIEEFGALHEGLRAIRRDDRYGFIDDMGRLRIANRYEAVQDFHSGRAAVKIRGRWGFIDQQDQIAIQPVFDSVGFFDGDFCIVQRDQQFGVVDQSGRTVLPLRYDSIVRVAGNRFKVMKDNLWGLADGLGRTMVAVKYDWLEEHDNGYVIVARDSKYGVLTVQGVSTIPEIYDWIGYDSVNDDFIAMKRAPRKQLGIVQR